MSALGNWSRDAVCFVLSMCFLVTLACCSAPPAAPSRMGEKWGLAAEYDNVVLLSAIGGSSEQPAWSPDGAWIAFQHVEARTGSWDNLANRDIYVIKVDTGEYNLVTKAAETGGSCEGPSWAPDSNRLVFACRFRNDYDLYTANISGGILSRLTDYPGDERDPSWSPDEKLIAFTMSAKPEGPDTSEYRRHVSVVAPDGTDLRVLQAAGYDATPAWSPGGEQVAFTYRKTDKSPPQLCIVDGNGSSLLCKDHVQCSDSTWSPDGDRIACLSRSEILVLQTSSNEPTILLDVGYRSLGGLSWSPDGDQLVFTAGPVYGAANDLYLLDLEE